MGTNLLGDSGAILTYLFTNLLERLPVIQTSLDVRTVFAIQMPILSHQFLLFWSEQQVVDQQKFVLDDGTGTDRVILSGIHAYYEPEELVGKTLIAITNLPPRAMMGIDSCGMLLSAVNERNGEEELHLLMVDNHIPAGAKLY